MSHVRSIMWTSMLALTRSLGGHPPLLIRLDDQGLTIVSQQNETRWAVPQFSWCYSSWATRRKWTVWVVLSWRRVCSVDFKIEMNLLENGICVNRASQQKSMTSHGHVCPEVVATLTRKKAGNLPLVKEGHALGTSPRRNAVSYILLWFCCIVLSWMYWLHIPSAAERVRRVAVSWPWS